MDGAGCSSVLTPALNNPAIIHQTQAFEMSAIRPALPSPVTDPRVAKSPVPSTSLLCPLKIFPRPVE